MSAQAVATARKHMTEKLDWARRSYARMQQAKAANQDDDLQDHFWSFLHATQLIWFYFGRWIGSGAKASMKCWQATLTPDEQAVWTALNELRSRDVHVQPVPTQQRSAEAQLMIGGQMLTIGGERLVITAVVHEVELNGNQLDAFALCRRGVVLLERFVGEFDKISPPTP